MLNSVSIKFCTVKLVRFLWTSLLGSGIGNIFTSKSYLHDLKDQTITFDMLMTLFGVFDNESEFFFFLCSIKSVTFN